MMNALYALVRFSPFVKFVVVIRPDGLTTHAPKRLPPGFLGAVEDVAQRAGLNSGVIFGKEQRGTLTLGFLGVPAAQRQPLLNSWHAHKPRYGG